MYASQPHLSRSLLLVPSQRSLPPYIKQHPFPLILLSCSRNFIALITHGVCVSHSVMSNSATPWTVAHQAPLSMGFSRQEYWNEVPSPSLEDLANLGIEPRSPALQAGSLPSVPPGKPLITHHLKLKPIHLILSPIIKKYFSNLKMKQNDG